MHGSLGIAWADKGVGETVGGKHRGTHEAPSSSEISHALPPATWIPQIPMGPLHTTTYHNCTLLKIYRAQEIGVKNATLFLGHCCATWHNWDEILLVLLPLQSFPPSARRASLAGIQWAKKKSYQFWSIAILSSLNTRVMQQGFWSVAILSSPNASIMQRGKVCVGMWSCVPTHFSPFCKKCFCEEERNL